MDAPAPTDALATQREATRARYADARPDPEAAQRDGLCHESGRLTALAHSVIKAVAAGVTVADVAKRYSLSGESLLWLHAQPAYVAMFEAYVQREKHAVQSRKDYAAWLHADVMREIHLRIVSEPESFDNKDLLALARYLGAISGVGEPKAKGGTTIQANVEVAERAAADRMDAARRRWQERQGKLEMLKSNGVKAGVSYAGKEVVSVEVGEDE